LDRVEKLSVSRMELLRKEEGGPFSYQAGKTGIAGGGIAMEDEGADAITYERGNDQ